MGQGEYPLAEFALCLSKVEERYANEVQTVVECFTNSRLDLPMKKFEEVSKAHLKISRHLRKAVDDKKIDVLNLWKICNVYSAAAVDMDNGMRDVRGSIRKSLKKQSLVPRRAGDDYRPSNAIRPEPSYEIYDTNKPIIKEKPRKIIDLFKRNEKKEEQRATKQTTYVAERSFTQHLVDTNVKATPTESVDEYRIPPVTIECKKSPTTSPVTAMKPPISMKPKMETSKVVKKQKSPAPAPPLPTGKPAMTVFDQTSQQEVTFSSTQQISPTLIKIDDNQRISTENPPGITAQKHSICIEDDIQPILTDGRIQRLIPEIQAGPPRRTALILPSTSTDDHSIDRF